MKCVDESRKATFRSPKRLMTFTIIPEPRQGNSTRSTVAKRGVWTLKKRCSSTRTNLAKGQKYFRIGIIRASAGITSCSLTRRTPTAAKPMSSESNLSRPARCCRMRSKTAATPSPGPTTTKPFSTTNSMTLIGRTKRSDMFWERASIKIRRSMRRKMTASFSRYPNHAIRN